VFVKDEWKIKLRCGLSLADGSVKDSKGRVIWALIGWAEPRTSDYGEATKHFS
jgi:hypothetical protein